MKFADYIVSELASGEKKNILLVAGGGTGKSYGLMHACNLLGEEEHRDAKGRVIVPVYVPLGNLPAEVSAYTIREYVLTHRIGSRATSSEDLRAEADCWCSSVFDNPQEKGFLFAFFLDAADETTDFNEFYAEIHALSEYCNCCVVLTGRFIPEGYASWERIEIRPFSNEQLKKYIPADMDGKSQDVLRSAFYLSKYAELYQDAEEKPAKIDRYHLLEAYYGDFTAEKYRRRSASELLGGQKLLTAAKVVLDRILPYLAYTLANRDTLVFSTADGSLKAAAEARNLKIEEICSGMLVPLAEALRLSDRSFRLSHTIARDFNAAKYLVSLYRDVQACSIPELTAEFAEAFSGTLNDEIFGFLNEAMASDAGEVHRMNASIGGAFPENPLLQRNILRLFLEQGAVLENADFSGRDLTEADFDGFLQLKNCNFNDAAVGPFAFGIGKGLPRSITGQRDLCIIPQADTFLFAGNISGATHISYQTGRVVQGPREVLSNPEGFRAGFGFESFSTDLSGELCGRAYRITESAVFVDGREIFSCGEGRLFRNAFVLKDDVRLFFLETPASFDADVFLNRFAYHVIPYPQGTVRPSECLMDGESILWYMDFSAKEPEAVQIKSEEPNVLECIAAATLEVFRYQSQRYFVIDGKLFLPDRNRLRRVFLPAGVGGQYFEQGIQDVILCTDRVIFETRHRGLYAISSDYSKLLWHIPFYSSKFYRVFHLEEKIVVPTARGMIYGVSQIFDPEKKSVHWTGEDHYITWRTSEYTGVKHYTEMLSEGLKNDFGRVQISWPRISFVLRGGKELISQSLEICSSKEGIRSARAEDYQDFDKISAVGLCFAENCLLVQSGNRISLFDIQEFESSSRKFRRALRKSGKDRADAQVRDVYSGSEASILVDTAELSSCLPKKEETVYGIKQWTVHSGAGGGFDAFYVVYDYDQRIYRVKKCSCREKKPSVSRVFDLKNYDGKLFYFRVFEDFMLFIFEFRLVVTDLQGNIQKEQSPYTLNLEGSTFKGLKGFSERGRDIFRQYGVETE